MIEPAVMLTVTGDDITERFLDGNIIIQDKKGEVVLRIRTGEVTEKFDTIPVASFTVETAPRINLELYVNGCYSILHVDKK